MNASKVSHMNPVPLFAGTLLNLAIPAVCYLCHRRISMQKECLCPYCFSYLERKKNLLKGEDELGQRYFYRAASLYDYGHIVREMLHIYKYRSIKQIGRFFSEIAVDVLRAEYQEFVDVEGIVAVPMHKKRYKERTFDHARFMANIIAKSFNLKDFSSKVKKSVHSEKQALLDFDKRLKNPLNSFKIKDNSMFQNKTILVIDDIFTTGATANALSHVLIENGVKRVYIFVIAAGDKKVQRYRIKNSSMRAR